MFLWAIFFVFVLLPAVSLGLVMRFFFADWYLVVGIPVAGLYFLSTMNPFGPTIRRVPSALVIGLTVFWPCWLAVKIPF